MVTPLRSDPDAIPFTSDWRDLTSFADIPANAGVSDAKAMLDGWTATRQKALRGIQLEAAVGEWNTVQAALLEILSRSRRAVARIVVPGGQTDWEGVRSDGGWTGTGFLVGPNLLLTNHHVLNSEAVAAVATAEFDFELPGDRLVAGAQTGTPATVRFELTPTRLFITSPVTGGGLDYSFVWITEKAAEHFGTIRMERGSFMISPFEPVFVIHHPRGRLKEVSVDDTEVLGVNSVNILYAADTDNGSSGACVFNRNGRLVALHHARQSGEQLKTLYPDAATQLSDGRAVTVGNEGVKISAIAIDLETRMRGGNKDAESAAEVLEKIDGSDTLTGIFGAIGRQSTSTQDSKRVREVYTNSEQDADIGFWNMQWLLPGAGAPVSAEEAVTAMIDLNQDVWFLTDVPPGAVERIVKGMRDRFSEDVQFAFGEPDAQVRQLATAVVWRPKTISCRKLGWPDPVSAAFTRPVPTLEDRGALFPTPPGIFRIGPVGAATPEEGADWQVNVVPVSLRAIRPDDLRRRLASKLMVSAIDLAIGGGDGFDWIVGGDVDPPLVHEDLEPFRRRGYRAIAATDRRRGSAVNYLRGASSGIRNVFVTGDLSLVDNQGDFFEVIENRTVDKFIYKLADNRPAVLRLSRDLGRDTTSPERLDALLAATLAGAGMPPADLQRNALTERPPSPRAWSEGLTWRGLDKLGFLSANRSALARLLAEVATRQGAAYPDLSPLTEVDLWVITFAEAGLGAGGVDPSFRHSNGEIGLYPLPDNIGFWIGAGAPAWNQAMPIETNIEAYALYLGQIRNKPVATVGARKLYRDLFRAPGIAGAPERQARLLAGIVHGYFVSSNYAGRSVPFERILGGLAADQPIDGILAGTDYVHAGSSILVNRQRNIDAALAAYRAA
ncbi:MAG TPA: serine protease [Amaricoccus sp.]|nr:serine protease [Amaricoccus sp.]